MIEECFHIVVVLFSGDVLPPISLGLLGTGVGLCFVPAPRILLSSRAAADIFIGGRDKSNLSPRLNPRKEIYERVIDHGMKRKSHLDS